MKARVYTTESDGRRLVVDHNYLRGWIEVDAAGAITGYELDTSIASLANRVGRAVADKLPRAHRAYVKFADALSPEKAAAFVEKCKAVDCELLNTEPEAWCGACGCPGALKTGCPQNRWK